MTAKKQLSALLIVMMTLLSGRTFGYEPDTLSCLVVKGRFENAFDNNNDPCTIEVIRDGEAVDTLTLTSRRRKFSYRCEKNRNYVLKVIKPGYAPMQVEVNTYNVERDDKLYQFEFTARLISDKRARTFNREALSLPYAVIRYDEAKKNFAFDEEHHTKLKFRLVFHAGQKHSMEIYAVK